MFSGFATRPEQSLGRSVEHFFDRNPAVTEEALIQSRMNEQAKRYGAQVRRVRQTLKTCYRLRINAFAIEFGTCARHGRYSFRDESPYDPIAIPITP